MHPRDQAGNNSIADTTFEGMAICIACLVLYSYIVISERNSKCIGCTKKKKLYCDLGEKFQEKAKKMWSKRERYALVLYLVDTHDRPWIDPEPTLDRSKSDPGSTLNRPWIDPESILDRSKSDPGSTLDRNRSPV